MLRPWSEKCGDTHGDLITNCKRQKHIDGKWLEFAHKYQTAEGIHAVTVSYTKPILTIKDLIKSLNAYMAYFLLIKLFLFT